MPFQRKSLSGVFAALIATLALLFLACGGGSFVAVPEISVSVSPGSVSLLIGQTSTFTATVTGSAINSVTWAVNGVPGGNSTVGTISTAGLYTAPATPPSPNSVTVTASSVADATASASASVTIEYPAPALSAISPAALAAGSSDSTLTLTGSDFLEQSVVQANGTTLATSYASATQLTAVVPSALLETAGALPITVVNPGPGGGPSNSESLTVSIAMSVSPATQTLNVSHTQQFDAAVVGTSNQSVTWSVEGVAGGNSTVGTISTAGLYTAPGMPPSPNVVTISATSAADATASASASVTVTNPAPALSAVSPSTLAAGSSDSTVTLNGSGFAEQSVVDANGTALATSFTSDTRLTAVVPAALLASAGTLSITVTSPSPGGGTSSAETMTVSIAVSVSPATETLNVSQTQQFSATVAGTANQTVAWSVDGVAGGNSTVGTISAEGLYTAPGVPPSPNAVTVTAASAADPTQAASATMTVVNPAPAFYSLSPDAVTAGAGDTALTIAGSNLAEQSVVYANSTALASAFVTSTGMTATLPASLAANTGTLSVTVVTPAPGGGTSTIIGLRVWPSYPRANAGSVLRTPPALPQIPITGTPVSVLDWTSKDNEGTPEDVLAADHSLTEMGIPNTDTTDFATAAANPFLAVAGVLNTSTALSASEISGLVSYVQQGGTLYLWEPSVTGLLTALGISPAFNSYTGAAVRPMTFDLSKVDPLLKYIDDPSEVNWAPQFPPSDLTLGYSPGSCTALAWWNTSDAAVLRCDLGTGRAYVFGWRLRPLLTLPERQIVYRNPEPPNTNSFIPDADICRLLMRGTYEGYAANPQVRSFAPGGHHAALIITHDVDDVLAYEYLHEYVDLEKSLGIKSTMLFTTTPYDTGYLAALYTASGMEAIQYAVNNGFDVEDHSFGHFPDFNLAPLGTGNETANNYMPMYDAGTGTTSGDSVIGEMGVSRWLLENDFGITVDEFRSGYLLAGQDFMQGLLETGYQRDSTYAAGLTRGSFPFVDFTVDATTGAVTTYPVMEFPLAISDDQAPLGSTTYDQYLNEWDSVIRSNYANNAPTVLLIHPVDDTIRIQILQGLLNRVADLDLWIGDWKTFAQFWESQGVTDARWP